MTIDECIAKTEAIIYGTVKSDEDLFCRMDFMELVVWLKDYKRLKSKEIRSDSFMNCYSCKYWEDESGYCDDCVVGNVYRKWERMKHEPEQ